MCLVKQCCSAGVFVLLASEAIYHSETLFITEWNLFITASIHQSEISHFDCDPEQVAQFATQYYSLASSFSSESFNFNVIFKFFFGGCGGWRGAVVVIFFVLGFLFVC